MTGERAVVVTGASSGLGEAIARALLEAGYTVFAGARGPIALADDARLVKLALDVTDADSIAAAVEAIERRLEADGASLLGLVNNAGVCVSGPLECVELDAFRRQLEVNLVAPVALTQALLPRLRAASASLPGGARVVHVGSAAGRIALPFLGPYAASKFGLEAVTDAMRRELAPQGIRVSLLQVGSVVTPIWGKLAAEGEQQLAGSAQASLYEARFRRFLALNEGEAKKRKTRPEDVARVTLRALTAPRPRPRYVVGSDARLNRWATRWLPDWVLDAFLARSLR